MGLRSGWWYTIVMNSSRQPMVWQVGLLVYSIMWLDFLCIISCACVSRPFSTFISIFIK